jgi:hypothetical protein
LSLWATICEKMKRCAIGIAGLAFLYLLGYALLRRSGKMEIWDYGTATPFLESRSGQMVEIIYFPLMRLEWHSQRLHELLESDLNNA